MPGKSFWKPGEAKPRVPGEGSGDPNPTRKTNDPGGSHGFRGRNQVSDGGKGGGKQGSAGKERKKTKGKLRYSSGEQHQVVERHESTEATDSKSRLENGANKTSKTALSGPSQGLLAMKAQIVGLMYGSTLVESGDGDGNEQRLDTSSKTCVVSERDFMQRSAKIEAAKRDQEDKRKEMDDDFSSGIAKRLRSEGAESKDRLVCRPDHQDSALIFLGRRSFGGFNAVAEAAYAACVRELGSGTVSAPANVEGENDDEGISDEQMARRLGNNLGFRRR